ncbi:hypothetical protein M5K25_022600 [Dendrobium thyrsiflorum]|uniref:Uncharacterized protein n=1 Tax=Dendrobium thyrsiflorum TaxID=117978 RepID=A0ABD0UCS5_DENTH
MWPRRTLQQTPQDAEIEDLQQEIIRLKRRLSRLERRTDRSTLGRDFNGDRLRSKYATTKDSRSLVPFKSLLTDDDDEGISDDQISYTPPSIEFSIEEIEDLLPKSLSLSFFDEPVFDEYDDDDMFFEVLDFDQPKYEGLKTTETENVEVCPSIAADLGQLAKVKNISFLDISPTNEIKEELLHLQNYFLDGAASINYSYEELDKMMINQLSPKLDGFRRKRWEMIFRRSKYVGKCGAQTGKYFIVRSASISRLDRMSPLLRLIRYPTFVTDFADLLDELQKMREQLSGKQVASAEEKADSE